mmetsp:Transcript_81260/g.134269  ORF Transcript_81260/g.134269 Transcript_81260/m.134269 type:complete len:211 (-) Transcript_81260:12-644(-)
MIDRWRNRPSAAKSTEGAEGSSNLPAGQVLAEGAAAPGDTAGGPSASPVGTSAVTSSAMQAGEGTSETSTSMPAQAERAASRDRAVVDRENAEVGEAHPIAAADSGGGSGSETKGLAAGMGPQAMQGASHEQQPRSQHYPAHDALPQTPTSGAAYHHQAGLVSYGEDADRGFQGPLVIQAEATLVEGLRALLVHHLKRSVGTNIISLSAS